MTASQPVCGLCNQPISKHKRGVVSVEHGPICPVNEQPSSNQSAAEALAECLASGYGLHVELVDAERLVKIVQRRLAVEATVRPYTADEAFAAGVTQASYRYHYKAALQRIVDAEGLDVNAAHFRQIALTALNGSPEETSECSRCSEARSDGRLRCGYCGREFL